MSSITVRRSAAATVALALAALAFTSSAPASYCPAGTDYVTDYCVNAALFDDLVLQDDPEAWYRLGDPLGASTMTDFSGNGHHGEYKNKQDSGPVGIAANDPDTARDFWGDGGYGYVNGLAAPGLDNGYTSYTMEIWFFQRDTDSAPTIHDDAMLMQDGGGGSLYIKNNLITFRNGPFDAISYAGPGGTFKDDTWYMVAARKQGQNLALWVRESPSAPTFFNPTPDATGSSSYLPGGQPTFYVGYGEYAPWFNGALDEAIYYRHAVPAFRLGYHFYADPAPAKGMARVLPARAADAPAKPGAAGRPGVAKPRTPLAKARAEVRRLTKLVVKARRWVRAVRASDAPAKHVRRAQRALRKYSKQLKRVRVRVKRLAA